MAESSEKRGFVIKKDKILTHGSGYKLMRAKRTCET